MDILKTATDWAKDELVSTPFLILAGALISSNQLRALACWKDSFSASLYHSNVGRW